jgi:hypothetical protein
VSRGLLRSENRSLGWAVRGKCSILHRRLPYAKPLALKRYVQARRLRPGGSSPRALVLKLFWLAQASISNAGHRIRIATTNENRVVYDLT